MPSTKYIVAHQNNDGEIWINKIYTSLLGAEQEYDRIIKSRSIEYKTVRIIKDTGELTAKVIKYHFKYLAVSCRELTKI